MSAVDQYLAARSLQITSPNGGRPTFRTVDQFNQTYWGGLDAAIYFDDLYIGDVVALHYEEQEAVYPLMGYADFVKRGSLHGARRVMGQFTINFQQALMMYLILEHIRAGGGSVNAAETIRPVQLTPTSKPQATKAAVQSAVHMLAPEAVTRLTELSAEDSRHLIVPTHQRLTSAIKKVKATNLDHVASNAARLKEQFGWAKPNALPYKGKGATLLSAVQNSLAMQSFQSKYDMPDGFTIGIVFGDTNLNDYKGVYQGPSSVLVPTDFDEAYFKAAAHMENNDVTAALSTMPPATVLQITAVDITGHGMTIDDSGRPLLQTYSFLAADITTTENNSFQPNTRKV